MSNSLLNEALALALKLSPRERLQLIEQVASSVERDMVTMPPYEAHVEHKPGTGAEIVAMLEALDEPIDLVDSHIYIRIT